jgi:hypothetical protein
MPRLFVQRFESDEKFAGCAWTRTHATTSASKMARRIHDLVANDGMGWAEGFLVTQPG